MKSWKVIFLAGFEHPDLSLTQGSLCRRDRTGPFTYCSLLVWQSPLHTENRGLFAGTSTPTDGTQPDLWSYYYGMKTSFGPEGPPRMFQTGQKPLPGISAVFFFCEVLYLQEKRTYSHFFLSQHTH